MKDSGARHNLAVGILESTGAFELRAAPDIIAAALIDGPRH